MPTYEYVCTVCHDRFDRFQRMTDEPIKVCPECGGEVRRLISAGAGFIFKGSGFYTTDYRSQEYKDKAKAEQDSASSSSSGSAKESKAKTATAG